MKLEPVAYKHSTGKAWLYSGEGFTINGAIDGQWRVHMDGKWSAPFSILDDAIDHVRAVRFWERH